MLRTLVLVLALGAPSIALAQSQHGDESAIGAQVVGDDGAVVGHVAAVQRDRHGRIVAAEIPGQEPANAPQASGALVADNAETNALMMIVRDRPAHPERMASASGEQVRAR